MNSEFKISACCIVKNEASRIKKWLEQAREYADEIIVVDTGSTDDTMTIAKTYGVRVYEFHWCNDFASARNAALSQAQGDWITFLDADEIFYDSKKIRSCLQLQADAEAIAVPIINIDEDDNNQELQRFYATRIWKNNNNRRYRGKVHETLCDGDLPVKVRYVADLPIIHTGYSSRRIKAKLERNLPLLLEQEKTQETPLVYRYLADTYYGLEQYTAAEKYIRLAIAKEPATVDGRQPIYLRLLDILQAQKVDLAEQIKTADDLLNENPEMADIKGRLAILLWRNGQREEAISYAQSFLEQFRTETDQNATTAYALLAPIKSIMREWQWEADWKGKTQQEQFDMVRWQCGRGICVLFAALFQGNLSSGSEYLPESMKNVLEYAAGERNQLRMDDLDGYRAGLNAVESYCDAAAQKKYANIALAFSWAVVIDTAKWFAGRRKWETAFELYRQVPMEAVEDAGDFWYEVGCCLYRLQPEAASECFERAQANGCTSLDIPAYLAWLKEAADD